MNDLIRLIEKAQSHVERAKDLAQKLKTDPEYQIPYDVTDIVNAINALAMENVDVLHIHTSFSAHVNEFSLNVNTTDTNYSMPGYESLLNVRVYLDKEDALEQLITIESQLTELIIEARDEAEVKAEPGA